MQNLSRQVGLVIFDCDGVLVDSEVISCRAHAETLTRHGYPITPDQVLERFLGVSDKEARQTIEAELGRRLPDDFESQMKQAALHRYADDLKAIPHINEAIAAISLPKCVASSGTPEKIRHGLSAPGFTICWRPTFSPPPRSGAASPRRTCFFSPPGECRPRQRAAW